MMPEVSFRIVNSATRDSEIYTLTMDVDYRLITTAVFTTREQAEEAEWAMRRAYASGLKTGLDVGMSLADRREK